MAYVDQEKKAKIAAELKKVMPKDWKYSLSVHHHSTIILTISAGPKELLNGKDNYRQLNPYYLEREFSSVKVQKIFAKIKDALNTGNHDNSDLMTDYFDVGHYVNINIGRWDKPYRVI